MIKLVRLAQRYGEHPFFWSLLVAGVGFWLPLAAIIVMMT